MAPDAYCTFPNGTAEAQKHLHLSIKYSCLFNIFIFRTSSGPYNQGLSVSHDSVFSPDSPTEQTHTAPPGLSLATRGVNMVRNNPILTKYQTSYKFINSYQSRPQ